MYTSQAEKGNIKCNIKYVGQNKNRINDRFQGNIFDIQH